MARIVIEGFKDKDAAVRFATELLHLTSAPVNFEQRYEALLEYAISPGTVTYDGDVMATIVRRK